jgi:acylphosphatase
MSEWVRVHIMVKGLVQGVFFRANTRKVARSLALTGWVRNLPDGSVEILAEGSQKDVEDLVRWCHMGPSFARVDNVDINWAKPTGEFAVFEIRS